MSAARYTAQKRLSAIAQGSKVQYANHKVSVDTISNGLASCNFSYKTLTYLAPPKCLCPPPAIPLLILDGGVPNLGSQIFFGGSPGTSSTLSYYGGSPGTSSTSILFGGYPGSSLTVTPRLVYTGGSPNSFGGTILNGGHV